MRSWRPFCWVCGVAAWTAYANVYADDSAVRTQAEQLARETAGCGKTCALARVAITRGIITQTIAYDFQGGGDVVVTCRRRYIAVGAHVCATSKP